MVKKMKKKPQEKKITYEEGLRIVEVIEKKVAAFEKKQSASFPRNEYLL